MRSASFGSVATEFEPPAQPQGSVHVSFSDASIEGGRITRPIEEVQVECPSCGRSYTTYYRASMNLSLDDFDDAYVEEMSMGKCPACGNVAELGSLVVDHDGTWRAA